MIFTSKNKKTIQNSLIIAFWLAVWQIVSMLVGQDLILVSPIKVISILFNLAGESSFWSTIVYSFIRIVSGFLLAIIIGVALAILSAANEVFKALLAPFFNVVKTVPVASFIILILIWAGSKNLSMVISFLMVLPIIYTNTLEGILRTDDKLLEMAQVFRISLLKKIRAIYLPEVMPYFTSACKVGLGLCWKSGVAAEVIGIPTGSIGEKLYLAKIFLNTGELFSWTIVIIGISFLFEKLFLNLLLVFERKIEGNLNR